MGGCASKDKAKTEASGANGSSTAAPATNEDDMKR
jgi:hypothetical protein